MTPELPEALQVALRVIEVLEELGAPYHVGGSYASSIHGVPRQTQGIDVVVDLPPVSARSLVSMIKDDFYVDEESVMRAIRDKSSFNVIHLDSGVKVDLFVRGDAPFDLEEFARHRAELVQTEPERHISSLRTLRGVGSEMYNSAAPLKGLTSLKPRWNQRSRSAECAPR